MRNDELSESERFPVGSRLKLGFQFEDRQHLDLQGEVRWRRDSSRPASEAGLGVQFVEMREEQRLAVEEFVRQRKLVGFSPLSSKRRPPSRRPRA